jgi:signal transduction histidine kinase
MTRSPVPNIEFISDIEESQSENHFSPEIRDALASINKSVAVAAAESLDTAMNFVFESTRDYFPCDRMGLAFLEDDGQRVKAYWTKTLYQPVLLETGYSEDLSGSSLEYILNSGKRRIIHDLSAYLKKHPHSHSSRLLVKEGIRSSMTCPLTVGNRIVALYFRSSRKAFAYSPLHVQMHLAIAERLSQAVEKAYRIEQLTKAIQDYKEMLGFVSHEIKSPISSIVMDCDVLLDGYLGDLPDIQRKKIERIELKGKHLLGMVRDYLDLARFESGDLKLDVKTDVNFVEDVLNPCIEIAEPVIQRRAMELVLKIPEAADSVTLDPYLFRTVMLNLLSNAVKYGYPVGDITVSVECEPASLVISVKNSGPGFPEEEKPKLFRKFSRLKIPELIRQEGTGLGLYTVWRIVQLHGGTIRSDSLPEHWAEFIIELPQ